MCPICMGTMFPAEEVAFSFCQPVAHFCHKACWNAQMEDQKLRCFVCRQREVGEMHLIHLSSCFGDDPIVWEVFSEMPPGAQVLLRLLQRSVITEDEFYQACDNPIVQMILRNIQ